MNLQTIAEMIQAEVVPNGQDIGTIDIPHAYSSDLMSDVLAFCSSGCVLITGLTNVQIIRTAQMMDIPAIIFVRGKTPLEQTMSLAEEDEIPILLTKMTMYEVCGRLYNAGLVASKQRNA